MPAPGHRQFESRARNALAADACNPAQRNSDIPGHQHLAAARFHIAIRIEAFGVLTRDNEIELATAQREASIGPGRPNVGEQIESFAQHHRRINLASRRILEFKGGRRSKHDAVRAARLFNDVRVDRVTKRAQAGMTGRGLLNSQLQIEAFGSRA